MTYKQMTKEIEAIPKQIAYLYNVRDTHYKGNKEIADMTCDIVNNLCAYQNYLRFEKEYKDKTLADMELRQCKREASKQEIKHAHWRFNGVSYECSACKKTYRGSYDYCPWCGAKMDGEGE